MICIVASPSRDSKRISFLAINMPHLLRLAQTGINQQDTSQQSPLLLHSTPIRTIHIKMTKMTIAPFMNTLKTTRKTYQLHIFILKWILQTLLIQNIKPTMSRLFYQWAMFVVPFSQHIVDTAVNCSFLVPAVNYSQDVNLTAVPLHLSSVSNPSHSWANVTYFNMDPYLRSTVPAGHNKPYNSNRTYTPTVKPNGPLTHPVRSPGFTVLPRTTGQPYQWRSHAP